MIKLRPDRMIIAAAFTLAASSTMAGDCRAVLRPLLLENPPVRERLLEAQRLCVAEAEAGDADAVYQSALLHLGLLDWDPDTAIPMIQTAARDGVAEAQFWLAWQYEEGPLLPNNTELAREWYEQAGNNEHYLALDRLASAYRNGELGLAIDARKAADMRARADRCKGKS